MPEIRIGTSGWSYHSWRGPFFPKELTVKDHLAYYATHFDSTELNAPFYRTPTLEAVPGWREKYAGRFHLCLEGFEVHHALETAERDVANSIELLEIAARVLGTRPARCCSSFLRSWM